MGRGGGTYHTRIAGLVAAKKGKSYATTMSWIRARVLFALLRLALLCLWGSWAKRRTYLELLDIDFDMRTFGKRLQGWYSISYFFLVFLVDFHSLNLISLILLTYFCYINVYSRGLNFFIQKTQFLRIQYNSTLF